VRVSVQSFNRFDAYASRQLAEEAKRARIKGFETLEFSTGSKRLMSIKPGGYFFVLILSVRACKNLERGYSARFNDATGKVHFPFLLPSNHSHHALITPLISSTFPTVIFGPPELS
jgi:hypothetical protein